MLMAQKRPQGLLAGLLAMCLFSEPLATLPQAMANDQIANDSTAGLVTGSIGPQVPQTELPEGSGAFRRALDLIGAKKYVEAYDAARAIKSDVERRTIQWAAIQFGGGAIDHESVARFAEDAPGFATDTLLRTRLEQALMRTRPSGEEVKRLLGEAMPNTISAKIALAAAYLADGEKDRAAEIARNLWVENFLDKDLERQVLDKLGSVLDQDDHWARAVHLMMHDRATGTERIMKFLSPAQKSLAIARNATSRKQKDAKALLDKVDPSLQAHPVYLFSRVQRARQAKLYESAVEWANKATGELPDAAEWWSERRTLTRQLLAEGDAKTAYLAAAGYTHGPDGRMVEASFHAGWIALCFLKDAQKAKPHFETMASHATLPDSVTQANYWLGRTLRALGDGEGAKAAFAQAAEYNTVFYGQLARAELDLPDVELRPAPEWETRQAAFDSLEVIKAVRLLAENGEKAKALVLLRHFAQTGAEGGDLVLAARLAQSMGAHNLSIAIAAIAEERGTPLDVFGFPKDGLPDNAKLASVDRAAVYAIARQESHFQIDAVSSVGARGLMQLMPGTAKETAKKLGLEYSPKRLTSDPAYNAALGSSYLAAQLDRFDGSLILAAAAYNAGGGNANKWIRAYGDPRNGNVDPVVWIELIPFQETRKYVQRVLGNYMVYKARLEDEDIGIRQALRRIPH